MGAYLMYRIVLKKPAKTFIDRLPLNEKRRIVAAIERLPNGEDIKRLKGYDGLFRLRVGDYRILYTVDHGKLTVFHAVLKAKLSESCHNPDDSRL